MTSREQAMSILEQLRNNHPTGFFNKIDQSSAGMYYILVYLCEHPNEIYASTIAQVMQISRSRVAVLIQKLIHKGYIQKSPSNLDKRIDVLHLTPAGYIEANTFQDHILTIITKIVHQIGEDKIYDFIQTSAKIKNVISALL